MSQYRPTRCQLLACLSTVLVTVSVRAEVQLSWDSTGHITVPTIVNGKGPFDFVLDTGADETGVYTWFTKSLDLPRSKVRELSGATGSEDADQHGLSRNDLVPLLETASRVSEVMTGKRELSMTMVRKLRERFHISADLLISAPAPSPRRSPVPV